MIIARIIADTGVRGTRSWDGDGFVEIEEVKKSR